MSDQAEKLRQRMRKLRDPIKDMNRIAIVGAQPQAKVALFSYNLAKALVHDGAPFIIEEESNEVAEAHLNVLLNLNNLGEQRLFEKASVSEKEGVTILSLPYTSSRFLDQASAYTELSSFLAKHPSSAQSLLLVQYSFQESAFHNKVDPACHLIVTKSEPTDLVSAYTIIKGLHSKKKEAPIGIVVTQVETEKQALTAYETLNGVSLRFLEKSLVYCGALTKGHGESGPFTADWLGRGLQPPSIYDACRRFILQEKITT